MATVQSLARGAVTDTAPRGGAAAQAHDLNAPRMPKKSAKVKSAKAELSSAEAVGQATWHAAISGKDWAAITVKSGKKIFPLRSDQQKELEGWAKAGKFDDEWLVVEGGLPVAFIAQGGTHNPLRLEGFAAALAWQAAVSGKDWAAITVKSGKKIFPLRSDQQKELEGWAKAGKFDDEWLVVEGGLPVAFVAQDGTRTHLALASGAAAGGGQKKAAAAAAAGAAPAKKQKKAAAVAAAGPAKNASHQKSMLQQL